MLDAELPRPPRPDAPPPGRAPRVVPDEGLAAALARALRAARAAARVSAPPAPYDPDALDARDPALVAELLPLAYAVNPRLLRLRVEGREHLGRAPALYVGNHSGGIAGPEHAAVFGTLWGTLGPDAPIYALAHDFAMRQVPRVGAAIQRFGALRAAPENAVRALGRGGQVLVYPGGVVEAFRATRRSDEIVLGERTGFVRVAQAAGVPIVPLVIQGAHRSAYILSEGEVFARLFDLKRRARVERFPIALALPWGLALGPWLPYLPLPFPIQLRILPPIAAPPGEDPARIRERVRAAMQSALDDLSARARARAR